MTDFKLLRQEIIAKTIEYHQARFVKPDFIPGKSKVNYAGRVFNEQEIINAVEASLDFWLTEGRFSEEFAEKIAIPAHTLRFYEKEGIVPQVNRDECGNRLSYV